MFERATFRILVKAAQGMPPSEVSAAELRHFFFAVHCLEVRLSSRNLL